MTIKSTSSIQNRQQAPHQHNHLHVSSVLARPITLAVMLGMGALSLTACDQKNNDTKTEEAAQVTKGSNTEDKSGTEVTKVEQPSSADSDSAVNNQEEEGTPVQYDFDTWKVDSDKQYEVSELKDIQKALGSVVSTDKNSLDFASHAATKYRFTQESQPYLDVIDSQQYLEFGWYYANPTDSDAEKQTSIEHAKKIYKLANNLMGTEGTNLVGNILTGQIIKNKAVGGKNVVLAKCEFYSCMIILEK